MLTEIAVVLSLAFVGLVVAFVLSRGALARGATGPEARRLVNAATRAAEAFLVREGKVAGASFLLTVLALLGAYGAFALRRTHGFTMTTALWTIIGTAAGAALTLAVSYSAMEIGLRATLGTIRASQLRLDAAASLSVRAAGATALAADALVTLVVTGLFGLVYLLGGGGAALGPTEAAAVLDRASGALPGVALGSVVTALVVGIGGASYHVSTSVGALGAESLDATDAKNPSLVATLVADHVGLGVRRAADMVSATTLAYAALLSIGVTSFRAHAFELGSRAWALVTLPLVVRAVGVVASAFGLLTARAAETGHPAPALWRGQATAGVLVMGGVAGTSLWLVGSPGVGWLTGAGTLGVLAAIVVGHSARLTVDRKLGPLQDLLEATRVGRAVTVARGVAVGLRAVLIPVVALAVALVAAFQLGQRSGLPGFAELATATAFASLVATSAFMLAAGLFGPIANGALAIATLEPEGFRPDARRRAVLLDDAGFEGGIVAGAFFVVAGCGAAVLAGLSIAQTMPGSAVLTSLARPQALWTGAIGSAIVLFLAGRALEIAARAARAVVVEVDRQLRGFPRESGVPILPPGFTPSYRAVIDLVARKALEGVLPLACLGMAGPVAVAICLRFLYGPTSGLPVEGLVSFVVSSAAVGLVVALFVDGASGVLGAAYRASRPRGTGSGFDAAVAGHELGSFLGGACSPAAHLFVKATAAAALLAAPFLTAF